MDASFPQLVSKAVKELNEKKGVSKIAVVKYIMANEPVQTIPPSLTLLRFVYLIL